MLRRTLLCGRKVEKVMVANRGEIACRVFRTCRDLHIQTVALFCEAERNAKHVMEADEAVCIGPPPAVRSYLRGDHIVSVAKSLGVDAIHPGYGFLSENAPFADAVAKAGIEFIGPPASAIVSMGSKSESKRIMEAAGVPVVPGYYGDDQSKDRLMAEANKIGYPVLIKAVSGGGGKGMKIVDKEEDFELLLESAKREATNFFKDDRVILERYITLPRHIECQIFCDMHGNGVFFFERDCSVQRRYQKVLEEAPAPHLSPEMRQKIGSVAVKAAKAVGYVGAGTVEFIFDTASDDFYFMEMNTRLQVEHPVSEEVCRIKGAPVDLVKLQILTAMGKPLGFSQEDVSLAGSCIEARVYAESPEKGFLPESGHLAYIKEPTQGLQQTTKVRLDTGFRQGDDVLIHYDPMISKLIVWGKDRTEALHGLRRALDEYHIVGINTNVEFLKRCLETKAFQDGGVTTNFIKENQDTLLKPKDIPAHVYVVAALSLVLRNGAKLSDAFRLNADVEQTISFQKADAPLAVRLSSRSSSGALSYQTQGTTGSLTLGEVTPRADASGLELVAFFDDGMRYNATVIFNERHVSVVVGGVVYKVETTPLMDGFGDASVMSSGSSRVLSPMPGKVGKLLVKPGSHVEKGQSILILEAMKMEHVIKSPKCGVVSFTVREGDMVGADQPMGAVSESD